MVRSDRTRSQQLNLADTLDKLRHMIHNACVVPAQPSYEALERNRRRYCCGSWSHVVKDSLLSITELYITSEWEFCLWHFTLLWQTWGSSKGEAETEEGALTHQTEQEGTRLHFIMLCSCVCLCVLVIRIPTLIVYTRHIIEPLYSLTGKKIQWQIVY